MTNPDPTEQSYWRPLRELQKHLEEEIGRLYADRGLVGVRPRFAYPLIRLARRGPMTIRDLAESLEQTHSAVSQTVTAMRKEDLVEAVPGPDARTRVIDLTQRGRDLVPFLEAEWRATEEAGAALDAELPFRLEDYVAAMWAKLGEQPFTDRIAERLDYPPGRPPGSAAPGGSSGGSPGGEG